MSPKASYLAILGLVLAGVPVIAQSSSIDLSRYKQVYPTLGQSERAAWDSALTSEYRITVGQRPNAPEGPTQGDLCTTPSPTPVNPFTVSSTTIGATNNYDIATTCGVAQTLFNGTGASLDVTFGVTTDANCSVTVSADPTGTNWDLALFVLNAPGAACTQLPALADPQCITMDDDGAANATETVTWAATAGTQYFVIIDGFNAATGTFDLTITGTGCNLVPVELQSFSIDR